MSFDLFRMIVKGLVVLVLVAILTGLIYWLLTASQWGWMAAYYPLLVRGLWLTLLLWIFSCVLGMILAIPIGLVQVTGPRWLGLLAHGFCTDEYGKQREEA